MTRAAAVTARSQRWLDAAIGKQGRTLACLLLGLLFVLSCADETALIDVPRSWLFDSYQKIFPRQRRSAPAIIVAIDERSLTQQSLI